MRSPSLRVEAPALVSAPPGTCPRKARSSSSPARQSELDKAVAEIGGNLSASQGDASKRADLDRIYALVKGKAGRIDVLFANAGTYEFGTLGKITEEHFIGSSTPTCAACSSRCRRRYHFCPTVRR
jgi:short chain dehydrogenase